MTSLYLNKGKSGFIVSLIATLVTIPGIRPISKLLSAKRDITSHTSILALAARVMLIPLLITITSCASNPPLFDAAIAGDTSTMQALLDKGTDVDTRGKHGETALTYAAGEGHEAAVQVLLDKGADVNAKAADGFTALMATSREGKTNMVRTLIAKGAEVNAKSNNGATPLLYAAGRGHEAAVQVLLDKGADVNAKDKTGSTALMEAAS